MLKILIFLWWCNFFLNFQWWQQLIFWGVDKFNPLFIHKNAWKSQYYYPDLIELQNAPLNYSLWFLSVSSTLSWEVNLNFPPITVNNLFKFLPRIVIWHFFLIHFKLSDKKLPLLTSKSLIIQVNNSWLASRGLKVTTEGVFFTRILQHPYQNHGVFKFQILGCTSFFTRILQHP